MLNLLDILFPDATLKLVKKLSPMKTLQPSINLWDTPEKYNPQSTFGTPQKNIMVGTIGQLGMLLYGFATTSAITI